VKLVVTWAALEARRRHPGLFSTGTYEPLRVNGPRAGHVFGFVRRGKDGRTAVVIVPRLVAGLAADGAWPVGEAVWEGTTFGLGESGGAALLRDVFTGERVEVGATGTPVGRALSTLPVAVLVSE
jgi:(1->4)-alpha-D-glucan 1-alpha-D-glucosylmutase